MQSLHTLVSVRPVAHEDFEQWLGHWKAYQAFYEAKLSAQTTEATWRRFLNEGEPMHHAVASDGRRLHGIVNFLYHRSTWAAQDVCYLEDPYVSPDVHGQQIGKQLIEYVRRQVEERRCARLYWHTQESDHRAQRLYDWVTDKPGAIEYHIELWTDCVTGASVWRTLDAVLSSRPAPGPAD